MKFTDKYVRAATGYIQFFFFCPQLYHFGPQVFKLRDLSEHTKQVLAIN